MSDEKIYQLWKDLKNSYYASDYEKTLYLVDEYLKIDSIGINDKVLGIYINSNIALNNYESAKKAIDLTRELFPYYYDNFNLIKKYIACLSFNDATKIIEDQADELCDKDYFNIAKQFLLYGEFDLAKKYFNTCISLTNIKFLKFESLKHIDKINLHLYTNGFIEQDYNYFKYCGRKLKEGHVVYARIKDEKYRESDHLCDKRPYLIWKIDGENISCFPLTKKLKNKDGYNYSYILYGQKYLNFDSDRRAKEVIVHIKDCDIEKIYEEVEEKDFSLVLKSLYQNMYFYNEKRRLEEKEFIDNYINKLEIEIGDVISFLNIPMKTRDLYLIIGVENEEYKVLKLSCEFESNNFEISSYKPIYIKKSNLFFSRIKLEYEKYCRLFKQISYYGLHEDNNVRTEQQDKILENKMVLK